MKTKFHTVLTATFAITFAIIFTCAWYNAIFFAPFSERLWTSFNNLLGDVNPGYASDLEFLTVIGASSALFYMMVSELLKIAK